MNGRLPGRPAWLMNLLLSVGTVLLSLIVAETVLHLLYKDFLIIQKEERAVLHRYDEMLGWVPRTGVSQQFTATRTISVTHNSRGFRDIDQRLKPGKRIVFIGDSFVWGYDVEQHERFTELLREKLPNWQIFNLGVSGYGTDQEYLLLQAQFDHYQPDVVFLVFCTDNDDNDNISNSIGPGLYFKPFFESTSGHLVLRGIPVPKSLTYFGYHHPTLSRSYLVRLIVRALAPKPTMADGIPPTAAIIQEMNEFVRRKGSRLMVGLTQRQPLLESVMLNENIPFLQLSDAERYNANGFHWTPAGHAVVSSKLFDFLLRTGVVPPGPTARQ